MMKVKVEARRKIALSYSWHQAKKWRDKHDVIDATVISSCMLRN